jgi:hypothetical protein
MSRYRWLYFHFDVNADEIYNIKLYKAERNISSRNHSDSYASGETIEK